MLRAGKGTVQRSGTLRLYADAVQSLYEDADTMDLKTGASTAETVSHLDETTVSEFVRKGILDIAKWQQIDDEANVFTIGMDSLQALLLVRKLRKGLALPSISPTMVYTHPSVTSLTDAILRLSTSHLETQTSHDQERSQRLVTVLNEYRDRIDTMKTSVKAARDTQQRIVILTGSTGALGSHLLYTLLRGPATHIYCLNRAADSPALQTNRNESYGLDTQLDPDRVTFLTADLSHEYFGLTQKNYNKLKAIATHIIHNAWPVNFNLSLDSFRPQLEGALSLIRFATEAANSPRFLFISSISSAMSYKSPDEDIPERVISALEAPGPNGYAESKYLTERILDYASHKLSVETQIARVGQIAGPAHHAGQWNRAEWFPSLIISSLHLGVLPDNVGPAMGHIDWVPIDDLAEVIVDLALDECPVPQQASLGAAAGKQARVFHPLHPHPTSWEAIRPIVAAELSRLGKAKNVGPMEIVPLATWLQKVRKDIESLSGSDQEGEFENRLKLNPAIKLLGFYEDVLGSTQAKKRWETHGTVQQSTKLRELQGIKAEWVEKWVRQAVME